MTNIIEATPDQAEIICDIANRTWWKAYGEILSAEQIRYMLDTIYSADAIRLLMEEKQQDFILLLEDYKPVAFAAYGPRQENHEVYKLHKIYCLPETQGKGYGKMLIDEVSSRARNAGREVIELNVNRYNNARFFYEKMGFEVVYEEDIPVGEYWMNDFVMRKRLASIAK